MSIKDILLERKCKSHPLIEDWTITYNQNNEEICSKFFRLYSKEWDEFNGDLDGIELLSDKNVAFLDLTNPYNKNYKKDLKYKNIQKITALKNIHSISLLLDYVPEYNDLKFLFQLKHLRKISLFCRMNKYKYIIQAEDGNVKKRLKYYLNIKNMKA